MRPDEPTEYVCQNCGEDVWLTNGDDGREYACECWTFPLYAREFDDLPKFWVEKPEVKDE